MSERYDRDRVLGYRDEAVSDMGGRWRDHCAAAAERWLAARWPGARAVAGVRHRDKGYDVEYNGWRIDVKWTPQEPGGVYRTPAYPGLRVPTWKPRRADLYALVIGAAPDRFDRYAWAGGWAPRSVVEAAVILPGRLRKTSGAPAPFFFVGFDYLRGLHEPPAPRD